MVVVDDEELKVYLEGMVRRGKTNKMILNFMRRDLNVYMSIRTLKRKLHKFGLRRSDRNTPIDTIRDAIRTELMGTGANLGYRSLAILLRTKYNFAVSDKTVSAVRNEISPPEPFVVARKAKTAMKWCPGPNYRWAADGHDKLQRFGIYIHGCVDVYSRKVIWCKVHSTNRHQPTVTSYFLDAVAHNGVSPIYVSADFGSETNQLCRCQILLWRSMDAQKRMYSTDNQPIELFWRQLQRLCTLTWHDRLEALENAGLFSPNSLTEQWALLAVFGPLIQVSIDQNVNNVWANHTIRRQANKVRPSGKPDDLFNFPEAFGHRQCGLLVSTDYVDEIRLRERTPDGASLKMLPDDVQETVDEWFMITETEATDDNAELVYLGSGICCWRSTGIIYVMGKLCRFQWCNCRDFWLSDSWLGWIWTNMGCVATFE